MHTIRLRGPWSYQVLHDADQPDVAAESLPRGKVTMPADWEASHGHGFRGRVCYGRHFHRPTGLDSDSVVFLRVAAVDETASIRLNGVDLGQVGNAAGGCFDVTSHLNQSNRLEVMVDLPPAQHESPGQGGLPEGSGAPDAQGAPAPTNPTGSFVCEVQLEINANE